MYSSAVQCMKTLAIYCILIETLLKMPTRASNDPVGTGSFK